MIIGHEVLGGGDPLPFPDMKDVEITYQQTRDAIAKAAGVEPEDVHIAGVCVVYIIGKEVRCGNSPLNMQAACKAFHGANKYREHFEELMGLKRS